MSKMHPKSDAIYDPKTGEILKYSELFNDTSILFMFHLFIYFGQ